MKCLGILSVAQALLVAAISFAPASVSAQYVPSVGSGVCVPAPGMPCTLPSPRRTYGPTFQPNPGASPEEIARERREEQARALNEAGVKFADAYYQSHDPSDAKAALARFQQAADLDPASRVNRANVALMESLLANYEGNEELALKKAREAASLSDRTVFQKWLSDIERVNAEERAQKQADAQTSAQIRSSIDNVISALHGGDAPTSGSQATLRGSSSGLGFMDASGTEPRPPASTDKLKVSSGSRFNNGRLEFMSSTPGVGDGTQAGAQGTAFFGQRANPGDAQIVSKTQDSPVTNRTVSAQADSAVKDSDKAAKAAETSSLEEAKSSAAYGFDDNPRTPGQSVSLNNGSMQENQKVMAVNNFIAQNKQYQSDLKGHEDALEKAKSMQDISVDRLNALQAQVVTDRNNIKRNIKDLQQFAAQPGVAGQLPKDVQRQVREVVSVDRTAPSQ